MKGRFLGTARTWTVYETGTPVILVVFTLGEGPHQGEEVTWRGWLTPKGVAKTIQGLRAAGWEGTDYRTIAALPTPVELVIDEKEYKGEMQTQVEWVNRPRPKKAGDTGLMELVRAAAESYDAEHKAEAMPASHASPPHGEQPQLSR